MRRRGTRDRWLTLAVVGLVTILLAGLLLPRWRGASGASPSSAPFADLSGSVDPFIGTRGAGNTFPGADVPFGMVQWSPESTAGGLSKPGGYQDGDLVIRGFGLTHLSGAGCVAFANLPFMPATRPIVTPPSPNGSPYSDRFVLGSQHGSPGRYGVRLASGTAVELSVTPRSGIGRFVFPRTATASVLLDVRAGAAGHSNIDGADRSAVWITGRDTLSGWVRGGHFCNLDNHYALYFFARFDRPARTVGTWRDGVLRHGSTSARGKDTGAWLTFDTRRQRTVQVKVGLSYVSMRNAQLNLEREDPGWNLPAVEKRAREVWNQELNRVQVAGGNSVERHVFYTALYHCLLFPSTFSDVNGEYIGFDGRIHQAGAAIQYANFSGWDIYRTEIPLLAWLAPRQTSDMMRSLLNDAQQEGWLPKWPVASATTGEMNGDSADPMLAGAWAFGAHGFDPRLALHAMVHGATVAGRGPDGYEERPQGATYQQRGYIPPVTGGWGAAATTLEFALDDYAIGRLAAAIGDQRTGSRFLARGQNWRRLFNPATGLIQARYADGTWVEPFNPNSTDNYVEGNAWQYRWLVPQNLSGLFHALGGNATVVRQLDRFFRRVNAGPEAPYDWAGNEPGLGIPWEYNFAGHPWRTQATVRRIITTLFSANADGLPGNDDLGTMSAWYVWAALGLYPEIPGVGGLTLGSPLFPRTTIQLAAGHSLTIVAPGARANRPYVQSLWLDGHRYRSSWLPLARLQTHSTLRFVLAGR